MTVKIYGPTASRAARALWIAHELGIPFEHIAMEMKDLKNPDYLKINPNGTVPAMIHDGVLVPESTVMMEYLDASFAGPRLRPDDPFERWRMRWW